MDSPTPKKEPKAKKDVAKKDEKELEREPKEAIPEDESEAEEVEVEEMEHDGVKYLRAVSTGIVYDMETSEEVGRWNEATKSIEVE